MAHSYRESGLMRLTLDANKHRGKRRSRMIGWKCGLVWAWSPRYATRSTSRESLKGEIAWCEEQGNEVSRAIRGDCLLVFMDYPIRNSTPDTTSSNRRQCSRFFDYDVNATSLCAYAFPAVSNSFLVKRV